MSDELAQKIEANRALIDPNWQSQDVDDSLDTFYRRQKRRKRIRVAAPVLAVACLVAVAVLFWQSGLIPVNFGESHSIASLPDQENSNEAEPLLPRLAQTFRFEDGSTATSLSSDSQIVATEVSSKSIRVRLDGGSVRFSVSKRPERVFKVNAGQVSIEVLGTIFSVQRDGERVAVSVERGRVRVNWHQGTRILNTGEQGIFPREGETTVQPPRRTQRIEPRRPSWQELAERNQFRQAYEALQRAGGIASVRGMEESLLAADVARLSGHPRQAANVLRRALNQHPSDPRASVASFTLGRVLLNQLGNPREAAQAFSRARRLAPGGALAEDALAREVEALSRAGASEQARRKAREYIERYPNGRRLRAVQRFGGIE